MPRTILHLDLDAFFCAVEEQRDPALRGKAFAVGGRPESRGVVSSCSYPARRFGVHSAMPMAQAVRLIPHLIVVPPNFKAYSAASQRVMTLLEDVTPLIEQISIDEAFLDVTGVRGAGEPLARQLQAAIRDLHGLPCSFGVAANKLVAKIANNIGKASRGKDAPPNAITVVPPGEEAAFLAPLPIQELWGVGPKTAEALKRQGIHTIGDLAAMPEATLTRQFGKMGGDLAQRGRGIDDRPIETDREAKSISRETTFTRDVRDPVLLHQTIRVLADGVGWRLRRSQLHGTTVRLKLRWSDFTTLTRQVTIPNGVNEDDAIYEAARELFDQVWVRGRAVRLIGVGVSGLSETGKQLGLWEGAPDEKKRKLQSALDEIKTRFGEDMIKRGVNPDDPRHA
ncbi:MAG: DNA polymerase IV [bacterium]|nr:DNA polymerase IV [bacterium]